MSIMEKVIIMRVANIYIVVTMLQVQLKVRFINPPYSLSFRH